MRSTRSRSIAPRYSPEEDAAHELAAGWMREAGLEVTRDEAGNLFGSRGDARVWAGSHLDSVPTAGRFDGVLGVVAAIEAADRLRRPCRSPSSRSAPRSRGRWAASASSEAPDAYLELHIEQGPCSSGSASRSASSPRSPGRPAARGVFEGRADHAGTTPMDARDDALVEAARVRAARARLRAAGDGRDRRRDRGRAERDERRARARDGRGRRARRRPPRSSTR